MQTTPNAEAIEAWNTVLFDKFTRFREVASVALGAHGDRALDRLSFRPGLRVVDIGCGFGDTTRELGRRVGSRGLVVGVDAAPRFIEVAAREAYHIPQVRYRVADVQTASLDGGPFDLAFSRMGTMFFAQPVVALRNIARSLVPDGILSMIVWRRRDANACFHLAEQIARSILPAEPAIDAPTCGPGPFSMADPDVVSQQLVAAGFRDVTFLRSDADLRIGHDLAHAVEFSLTLGPAGELLRLAGPDGEARRAELEAALSDVLAPYVTKADGVRVPSSTWHITARKAMGSPSGLLPAAPH